MATLAQIQAALGATSLYLDKDDIRVDDPARVTSLYLTGSAGWDHDDMRTVAKALLTEKIDVAGGGCDTCGYGASLSVRGIPHPFPCLAPGCKNLPGDDDRFCSDECGKAWRVNEALVGEGSDD
jgi:hypothetical protein